MQPLDPDAALSNAAPDQEDRQQIQATPFVYRQ